MRRNIARFFRLVILAAILCFTFQAAGAEQWYVENEWNILETAMDVSQGIGKDADGDLARIQRNGILRVATDLDNPPLSFLDPEAEGDGQYAGVDMELARLIAKKMGVQLVIVPKKPIYKLPVLTEDLADLTISSIVCTPGRALYYTLSRGYYKPEDEHRDIGILVREGTKIVSLNDLENQIIVAESNSLHEAFGIAHIPNYMEFRRVGSIRNVYKMVAAGKAFAGIVSVRTADTYISTHPDCGLQVAEGENLRFFPEEQYLGYRVAADKGETRLIAFVNGVIEEAEKDNLIEQWEREARKRAGELGLLGE